LGHTVEVAALKVSTSTKPLNRPTVQLTLTYLQSKRLMHHLCVIERGLSRTSQRVSNNGENRSGVVLQVNVEALIGGTAHRRLGRIKRPRAPSGGRPGPSGRSGRSRRPRRRTPWNRGTAGADAVGAGALASGCSARAAGRGGAATDVGRSPGCDGFPERVTVSLGRHVRVTVGRSGSHTVGGR
jgi:hypothetical protein